MTKRHLSFIPIPALISIIGVIYLTVEPSLFFEPGWLLPITNTVFITLVSFIVSYIAVRNYGATGRIQILLLGCGVLPFGIGAAVAGWLRGAPGSGVNLNVTIYNTGALIGAIFHFIAALILLVRISPEVRVYRRTSWAVVGYVGLIIFMALFTLASLRDMIPPFFVQGIGPTTLRQAVLGTAAILLTFSFFILMGSYLRNREVFLYWYSSALALIAIGLSAIFIQRAVGSPIGWTGRFSQYLGGIYFLIAIITAIRSAQARKISFDSVLTTSLSPAEEKFRALAENSPDVIDRFDKKMRHIYVNPAGLRLYGKRAGSIVGRRIEETGFPEAYCSHLKERIEKTFETGQPTEAEGYLPTEGGVRFYQSHCVPEYEVEGTISNVLVVSRDLTERKQAEEQLQEEITDRKYAEAALRETREYLENLLEYASAPIIVWDPTLRMVITRFNHAFERLTGYAAAEVIGKELPILFPQTSRDESMSKIGRTLIGEHWESAEIPILCKNGDIRIVLWNSANIYTEDGKTLLATIAQGLDITERKLAEEALQASETKYRIVAHNTYDWEFWRDPNGHFLYVSPSCKRITGYKADEFIKDPGLLDRLIHPDDRRFFASHRHQAEQKIESGEIEFRIIDRGGSPRWIGHVCQPIFGENKVFLGTRGSNRDITERKRAEQEIKDLNKELKGSVVQLEAANKELEAFSYSVSHDLRAPLRAIDGFSRVILEDCIDKFDDEGKRYLNIIRGNTQKMGQLIDDLLVFSRLGRLEIRVSAIDMRELAQDVFKELKPAASERKIQFDIRELPPAQGDPSMIRQVFANLLSNAIKFTKTRNISFIQMSGSREEAENVYYVKDDGVGFDMQYANKLFGVFQRLHGTEEFEGTGVGLAIVQRIIHRHGGRVWAEGKVNEGACFYFTLPVKS